VDDYQALTVSWFSHLNAFTTEERDIGSTDDSSNRSMGMEALCQKFEGVGGQRQRSETTASIIQFGRLFIL
jgi:hypothetical protein